METVLAVWEYVVWFVQLCLEHIEVSLPITGLALALLALGIQELRFHQIRTTQKRDTNALMEAIERLNRKLERVAPNLKTEVQAIVDKQPQAKKVSEERKIAAYASGLSSALLSIPPNYAASPPSLSFYGEATEKMKDEATKEILRVLFAPAAPPPSPYVGDSVSIEETVTVAVKKPSLFRRIVEIVRNLIRLKRI